jgi:hypothetical protein
MKARIWTENMRYFKNQKNGRRLNFGKQLKTLVKELMKVLEGGHNYYAFK